MARGLTDTQFRYYRRKALRKLGKAICDSGKNGACAYVQGKCNRKPYLMGLTRNGKQFTIHCERESMSNGATVFAYVVKTNRLGHPTLEPHKFYDFGKVIGSL